MEVIYKLVNMYACRDVLLGLLISRLVTRIVCRTANENIRRQRNVCGAAMKIN